MPNYPDITSRIAMLRNLLNRNSQVAQANQTGNSTQLAQVRGLWGDEYKDFQTSEEARKWVEEQELKNSLVKYQGFWPTFGGYMGKIAKDPSLAVGATLGGITEAIKRSPEWGSEWLTNLKANLDLQNVKRLRKMRSEIPLNP